MTELKQYLKFISFRQKLMNQHGFDHRDCLLLEFIAEKIAQKHPCTVSELIQQKKIGSPAIIHASFKRLIKDGYIRVELDQKDHRIKYSLFTPKANKFFNELLKEFPCEK
jgi:DNA-binding MarR family transcriptional regulator